MDDSGTNVLKFYNNRITLHKPLLISLKRFILTCIHGFKKKIKQKNFQAPSKYFSPPPLAINRRRR